MFDFAGADEVNLNGTMRFTSVQNLTGGTQNDRFVVAPGASVSGNVIGDGGVDTLDYAAWAAPVNVNLPAAKATAVGGGVWNMENVIGGSGDDMLIGDGSDNELNGAAGNDVLVGNAGADTLNGWSGRDLLVGGTGADKVGGGEGDDVLIDGTTSHDANPVALAALRSEWVRTDASYPARIQHLRFGGAGALNGNTLLNSRTIAHDADTDTLFGGGGGDWFWARQSAPVDLTPDKLSTERLNMM